MEKNPSPKQQCDVADWELEEVPDTAKEYKTDQTICAVCGSGSVTPVVRTKEKKNMELSRENIWTTYVIQRETTAMPTMDMDFILKKW